LLQNETDIQVTSYRHVEVGLKIEIPTQYHGLSSF